ncbi:MAG: hypothetical protein IJ262_05505 [Clostridia bacterium]|nr:hypothetical protein [Clostridia bacterium]
MKNKPLKKVLSVFLAVLMVMSAWVFVAPEKAEAAGENYYIEVVWNASRTGHSDNLADDGNDDGDCIGFFIKTKDNHGTGTEYTYTADLKGKTTNTDTTWSQTVTGFPTSIIAIVDHGWAPQTAQLDIKSIKIGKDSSTLVTVFNGVITLKSSTKFKRFQYNVGNTSTSNDSDNAYLATANSATWAYPKVSKVVSNPTAQTVTVQKTGISDSKSFTATYKDQYGVTMAGSGATGAFDPALTGASITMSGNTATVTAGLDVFNNLTNYSTSTGKGTRTLKITNNGVVASCTVTFQAPKFSLKFNKQDGTNVYSNDLYYKSAVDCGTIASGLENSVVNTGDATYHDTYIWDTSKYVTSLTADTVVTEVKDKSVEHTFGDITEITDTEHKWACSVCGYVKSQEHIKDSGTITTADTCTQDGVKTYNCAVCGKEAIATETINKISGHEFTGDFVVKVDGKDGTHYKKCIRFDECRTYGFNGVANNCEAHNWDKDNSGVVDAKDGVVTTAPGCLTEGVRQYSCTLCSATYTEPVAATGHQNVTKTDAKDVTMLCGGDGNVAFWSCADCGKIYLDENCSTEVSDYTDNDGDSIPDVLETKGPEHDFTGSVKIVNASKDGSHNFRCKNCGEYGIVDENGNKILGGTEAHKWNDGVVTKEASCIANGEKTYTCSVCTQTYTETLPKVAHDMAKIDAVEAKCGVPGNNEYYYCETCKDYFKDKEGTTKTTVKGETIPALVHTAGNHKDTDTLFSKATCMGAAVYYDHCDYCDLKLTSTHPYGDPDTVNGHDFTGEIKMNSDRTHSFKCVVDGCGEYGNAKTCNYKVTADVASTCKTYGYTTYTCSDCGHSYNDYKTALDFTNHEGEEEIRIAFEATCSSNGYTGDIYCLGCGSKKTSGTTIVADPSVHPHENMKDYGKQDSTCQTEGYKAYRYCASCGTYEIPKETIAKKSHKFTSYAPNNDGTHTSTCDTCNASVAAPATYTTECSGGVANCVEKAICSTCGATYGETDSNNHKKISIVPKKDSTCQTEGYEAYHACKYCLAVTETIIPIEKKAHVYGSWTQNEDGSTHSRACVNCKDDEANGLVVATETDDCHGGIATCLTVAKCSDCGGSYGELNPSNHETQAATVSGAYPAECGKEGYTGDRLYNCCNAVKEKGSAIPALEHDFSVEVENSKIASTCVTKGEISYKCSRCDETKKVELDLDPKNHDSEETDVVKEKDATCTSDGYTGDTYYKCCYDPTKSDYENRHALVSKGSVIKANGQHVLGNAVPEYMLDLDENGDVVIDEEGNFVLSDEADYEAKIDARRDDDKWYHAQICSECKEVVFSACYTYEHTYNCVETDICEVCSGLCSLIDENKHKGELTLVPGTPSTCIKEGVKAYYICDDCENTYLDSAGKTPVDIDEEGALVEALAPHKVDWANGVVTKEASCGENGETTYKCTQEGCDHEVVLDNISSSGVHEWSTERKIVKEPTCYSTGYSAYYCTVCGKAQAGTYLILGMIDHDFDEGVVTVPATCTEDGVKTVSCQAEGCTKTQTEVIAATGHEWNDGEITKEATCGADGVLTKTCGSCGETTTEAIAATGEHTAGEWVVVKAPTCCEEGLKKSVCTVCGKTYTEKIPATNEHTWKTAPGKAPTCSEDGYTNHQVCADCGAIKEGTKTVVPADESYHKDYNADGLCDECDHNMRGEITPDNCNCWCHKTSGLSKFIYKIILFFWKLFGISETCPCGIAHY